MNDRDRSVLQKIISSCDDTDKLMSEYDRDFQRYKQEISFQYSCNMCIIQIGELVSRLSPGCIEEYHQIPWHAIKAMRNLHAHDYERVDLEIVWNSLVEDIPELKNNIESIL